MTTPNDPYSQGGQPPQGGYPQQPGQQPFAPPPTESEMRRPARPKSVDTAYLLWLIAAGVSILGTLLSFITAGDVARETAKALNVDPSLVADAEPSYGGAIFGLVLAVIWIVVVMQMRGGANWARIVLTVLGGLSIIGNLINVALFGVLFAVGFVGVIQALLVLVSLATIIGAIVFMFKSDSNHYFKAS